LRVADVEVNPGEVASNVADPNVDGEIGTTA
jgi:hypothetical protein